MQAMTDDTGMLQHAIFSIRGTTMATAWTTTRALLLMALLEGAGDDDPAVVRALGSRYLAFVSHAFDRATGRFRNFLSYAALAGAMRVGGQPWASLVGARRHPRTGGDPGGQSLAGDLFHAAIPAVTAFTSPRAWAYALLGLDE